MGSHDKIQYPYMPEDRHLCYVPHDHVFMQEAHKCREQLAGDPLYPVGAVLVRDGCVIARSGNGYSLGCKNRHICPRVVLECPTGTRYELCDFHDGPGHAEQMAIKNAHEQGAEVRGADLYMYGHWWACKPCWDAMIEAGIRNVYVTDDAHERFAREVVHKTYCIPSISRVYFSAPMSALSVQASQAHVLYEALACAIEELSLTVVAAHRDSAIDVKKQIGEEALQHGKSQLSSCDVLVAEVSDPSHGVGMELMYAHMNKIPIVLLSHSDSRVSASVLSLPEMLYHAQYENTQQACKMLKNILKQL